MPFSKELLYSTNSHGADLFVFKSDNMLTTASIGISCHRSKSKATHVWSLKGSWPMSYSSKALYPSFVTTLSPTTCEFPSSFGVRSHMQRFALPRVQYLNLIASKFGFCMQFPYSLKFSLYHIANLYFPNALFFSLIGSNYSVIYLTWLIINIQIVSTYKVDLALHTRREMIGMPINEVDWLFH